MMISPGQAGGARAPMLQLSKSSPQAGGYLPLASPFANISQLPGSARQVSTNGASPAGMAGKAGSDIDVVAFLAPQNFVVEGEDKVAQIRVIRIGSLQGTCRVGYITKDQTARAGQKYEHTEGTLTFSPGEAVKLFEVTVIDDDAFDTTLEFECILQDPENCDIDSHSWYTRVMIHDTDTFPANHLKETIEKGDEALMDLGGTLLKAFYYFCYSHVPSIRWKSWMMIMLAQLDNAYYLLTIYLRVYMVDTVLKLENEDTLSHLWARNDRGQTMVLLSALWVFPNFILLGVEYFEMVVLEMGFNIRYHLRVNLFRKFLSYTNESRSDVPIQDLKASIMEDIPDVVSNGYLGIFDILAMAGKLIMVACFMIQRHPHSAVPLLVYPLLIWISLRCNYKKRLKLSQQEGDGEGQTVAWLIHAHHAQKLIQDYRKRTFVVARFEEVLRKQRQLVMTLKRFNFWNGQLIPWITLIVIGLYMAVFGQLVVLKKLSLGSFLATINIYKDLGDRFSKVQDNVEAMVGTIEPLTGLTGQFNLETDVPRRIDFARSREDYVLSWLDGNNAAANSPVPVFDQIPIQLKGVTVEHSPSLSSPTGLSAPQGTVVHVIGKHTVGKGTILNLLSDKIDPSGGEVLCPPHVRILNVSTDPLFVDSLGFHGNLVFGFSNTGKLTDPDPDRLRRICVRLGLTADWMLKALDDGMKDPDSSPDEDDEDEEKDPEDDEGGDDDSWMDKLSRSEQKRFQLARAFAYDPEVLIIHKPVDDLDGDLKNQVLGLMREFVDKRGLELPESSLRKRRPHTLIFSGGSSSLHPISDIVWRVHDQQVMCEMGSMMQQR